MSAKKLRCSPEYNGIRLIIDKVPASVPASANVKIMKRTQNTVAVQ